MELRAVQPTSFASAVEVDLPVPLGWRSGDALWCRCVGSPASVCRLVRTSCSAFRCGCCSDLHRRRCRCRCCCGDCSWLRRFDCSPSFCTVLSSNVCFFIFLPFGSFPLYFLYFFSPSSAASKHTNLREELRRVRSSHIGPRPLEARLGLVHTCQRSFQCCLDTVRDCTSAFIVVHRCGVRVVQPLLKVFNACVLGCGPHLRWCHKVSCALDCLPSMRCRQFSIRNRRSGCGTLFNERGTFLVISTNGTRGRCSYSGLCGDAAFTSFGRHGDVFTGAASLRHASRHITMDTVHCIDASCRRDIIHWSHGE